MGPPPRSLAADAHGCIMGRMLEDLLETSHTEYKVVARLIATAGRLASDCLVRAASVDGRRRLTRVVDRRRPSIDAPNRETAASGKRTVWQDHCLTTRAPYKGANASTAAINREHNTREERGNICRSSSLRQKASVMSH